MLPCRPNVIFASYSLKKDCMYNKQGCSTSLETLLDGNPSWMFLVSSHGRKRQGPSKPNLSDREIDEIICEWKPEPLVPPLTNEETADASSMPVSLFVAPIQSNRSDIHISITH